MHNAGNPFYQLRVEMFARIYHSTVANGIADHNHFNHDHSHTQYPALQSFHDTFVKLMTRSPPSNRRNFFIKKFIAKRKIRTVKS